MLKTAYKQLWVPLTGRLLSKFIPIIEGKKSPPPVGLGEFPPIEMKEEGPKYNQIVYRGMDKSYGDLIDQGDGRVDEVGFTMVKLDSFLHTSDCIEISLNPYFIPPGGPDGFLYIIKVNPLIPYFSYDGNPIESKYLTDEREHIFYPGCRLKIFNKESTQSAWTWGQEQVHERYWIKEHYDQLIRDIEDTGNNQVVLQGDSIKRDLKLILKGGGAVNIRYAELYPPEPGEGVDTWINFVKGKRSPPPQGESTPLREMVGVVNQIHNPDTVKGTILNLLGSRSLSIA